MKKKEEKAQQKRKKFEWINKRMKNKGKEKQKEIEKMVKREKKKKKRKVPQLQNATIIGKHLKQRLSQSISSFQFEYREVLLLPFSSPTDFPPYLILPPASASQRALH